MTIPALLLAGSWVDEITADPVEEVSDLLFLSFLAEGWVASLDKPDVTSISSFNVGVDCWPFS